MKPATWQPAKFVKHLIDEFNFDISKLNGKTVSEKIEKVKANLRYYQEDEGLLNPQINKNNRYRFYSEKDIWQVFKIIVLRDYIGLSFEDIRRIEGITGSKGNYIDLEKGKANRDVDYFFNILVNPEKRKLARRLDELPKLIQFQEMLTNHLINLKKKNPNDWYESIEWYDLYKRFYTNFMDKSQITKSKSGEIDSTTSVNISKLDQIIKEIIENIEMSGLIDEVVEELKDRFYYDAEYNIMVEYNLDEFDAETASPKLAEKFDEELQEIIDQNEEEAVLDKIEQIVEKEIASKADELLSLFNDPDLIEVFPSLKALKDELRKDLVQQYNKIREKYYGEFIEAYETRRIILNPIDLELLSFIFSGKCSISYYFHTLINDERIISYLDNHYLQLKKCAKYLVNKYSGCNQDGFATLCLIPGGEETIMIELKEFGIPLINIS